MSKTIYIGGRLESKEKGNVVTGANAILDDTKGKKQNVINKETDDELARLEQSKQDNLNFDNAPTENSTNPVTSGGVYTAEKALSDAIEAILLLIPSAATALNKLVDTNTMNSSISTATATFRGTYNVVSDLGLTYQATHAQIEAALDALGLTADNNDFAFVQIPVSDQSQDIAKTERYKNNGTNWQYEYDLNTSGFTAAQWGAINSGITVALVTKLTDLPTAAALQLALNGKQDTLTFDNEPTALSQNPVTSGGIYTAIQAVVTALGGRLETLEGLIPSEASSSNKLTDKAYVDGLIQAITELIPAEATSANQLADKAYVLAQILAATPAFKGQFVTLAELQAVASPKAGDLGIVRTKDSDGMDVFTVYQYLNNAWDVFYSLSYHPQTKPATTGTTGDYPYNGMGRVELAMNMVNTGTELAPVMVNQLTQDMFYKGAVGSRVPNTNTIFVIRYDYVLGEDITIPDNCVLEFDGGSISGLFTLTFNNTSITGTNILFTGVNFEGTVKNHTIDAKWFSDEDTLLKAIKFVNDNSLELFFPKGDYSFHDTVCLYNGASWRGTKESNIYVYKGSSSVGDYYNAFACGIKTVGSSNPGDALPWTGKISNLNFYPVEGTMYSMIFIVNCENVTIENCYFDQTYSLNGTIHQAFIHSGNIPNYGYLKGRDGIYVKNNICISDDANRTRYNRGESSESISLCVSKNCFVEKNKVYYALDDIALHNITNGVIRDNYIFTIDGRYTTTSSKHILIENNIIETSGTPSHTGIIVHFEYEPYVDEDIVINNNKVLGEFVYGILIKDGKHVTISNNYLTDSPIVVDPAVEISGSSLSLEELNPDYIEIINNTASSVGLVMIQPYPWLLDRSVCIRDNKISTINAYGDGVNARLVVKGNQFNKSDEAQVWIIPRFLSEAFIHFSINSSTLSDGWHDVEFEASLPNYPIIVSNGEYIINARQLTPVNGIFSMVTQGGDTAIQITLERDGETMTFNGVNSATWNVININLPTLLYGDKIKMKYLKQSAVDNGIVKGYIGLLEG